MFEEPDTTFTRAATLSLRLTPVLIVYFLGVQHTVYGS
jgi:hypothetical protein